MELRYRKSTEVLPGVKLNLSKSGISTSVGKRGAKLNFSRRGTRATVGLPGSGLSYSTMIGKRRSRRVSSRSASRSSLAADRERIMRDYDVSERQMRRFERKVKRHPKRYARMAKNTTDQEMADYIKYGYWNPKRIRVLLWVILFCLILSLVASFSGKTA